MTRLTKNLLWAGIILGGSYLLFLLFVTAMQLSVMM